MNSQKKKNQAAQKDEKKNNNAAPSASVLNTQQNLDTEEDQAGTLAGASNKTFLGVDTILYPKEGKMGQAPAKKSQ